MKSDKTLQRFFSLIKRSNNTNGFSLLEVLISVTILSIIITPLLAVFTSSFQTTVLSQDILDGTYISQNVYENLLADDYRELLATSAQKQSYDSDGDGTDDCYVQAILYPDGVYSTLTSEENPTYLHINIIGEEIILFGDSGTNDTANTGTQITAMGDIVVTNSSSSDVVQVKVGSADTMIFYKKYITCPVVIIANLYSKSTNTQDITLSIVGDTSSVAVVEYARSKNYDELICTQLSDSNIYYGINDFSTTLIHAYIRVFDIDDSDKRFGFLEGTFETYLS